MYGAGLRLLRFSFCGSVLLLDASLIEIVLIRCRFAGNVFHGYTFPKVGCVVRVALIRVNIQIPDELVIDDKALGLVFSRSLHLVHIDVVDELV